MIYVKFTAQERAVLPFRDAFKKGDYIYVPFADECAADKFARERMGEGGPWGWGGYTSEALMEAMQHGPFPESAKKWWATTDDGEALSAGIYEPRT